ncbi:Transportin-3 [Holothuria leucospilota]|uniref:Transportin-3 n=1 Tax=Holothuria leucospilota TaxID=206669 RepID=A0A9Q1BSK3_HOLLE|nr:Transportin-3 [Holothuria leucospilota]
MDTPPTIESVIQATTALYHNPDTSQKDTASKWLQAFQKSVYAWQISDQLLQMKSNLESCYIAAQTMRTKVQYSFHELPADSHNSLRDSLINHLETMTDPQFQITSTQLCLALADLALQMVEWKNSPNFIIQKFSSNTASIPVLLELLTVLPEEVHSKNLRLGMNRREEFRLELRSTSATVIALLTACTDNYGTDERLMGKVFKCLASWFSLGIMPSEDIAKSKLIALLFQCLRKHDAPAMLHEAASDCLCAALYGMEDIEDHMTLATTLFQGTMELPQAYHMTVAADDVDKCVNYCRIFTELAEACLEAMVNKPGEKLGDLRILDALLACISGPYRELADITFNFWYRLSEVIYKKNIQMLNDHFRPYVQRLIQSLCVHCQMEPDHEGIPDLTDDFGDFRARVTELIKDVIFIMGSTTCFREIFQNITNQQSPAWEVTEASLFVMAAVAKNVLPDEGVVVPMVMQAIFNLPESSHLAVRYTSLRMVGELSEWLSQHADYIDPSLNLLTSGLKHNQLASISATSIQKICENCKDLMHNHFDGLMNIARAVDGFSVSPEAAVGLVQGAAVVLSRLPLDKIPEGLKELTACQITPLSEMLKDPNIKRDNKENFRPSDPTLWLDRLAAIFRYTTPSIINGQAHPCAALLQSIWQILSETLNKYQTDIRIVERWCRCIRFAVRTIGKTSNAMLSPLVMQMVNIYQTHQHSCFLYLGSILVDEYGTDQNCKQGLLEMLKAFITPTYKILEGENGLRNHPDTVDDFFRLCIRFLQRCPVEFLQCDFFTSVIQCGMAGLKLDHRDANGTVAKFFIEFVKCGNENWETPDFNSRSSLVQKILESNGDKLVSGILEACVFHLPTYMVPDHGQVLYELLKFSRQSLSAWLEVALQGLPMSTGGTIGATVEQMGLFHNTVSSAEEDIHVTYALRDFTRLFR